MLNVEEHRRNRIEAKSRVERAAKLLQEAHDQLVMATAVAKSNTDAAFIQAQDNWRKASSNYNNALNEYTRLLGPENM